PTTKATPAPHIRCRWPECRRGFRSSSSSRRLCTIRRRPANRRRASPSPALPALRSRTAGLPSLLSAGRAILDELQRTTSVVSGVEVCSIFPCRLQAWPSGFLGEVTSLHNREVLAPRSHRIAVAFGHYTHDLRDVPEIVRYPGRDQLPECDAA